MKKTVEERRTSQGLPYTITEEKNVSQNVLYIFEGMIDKDVVCYEDQLRLDQYLHITEDILDIWSEEFENPELRMKSKKALAAIGEATLGEAKAILFLLNTESFENEKLQQYILEKIKILDNKVTFLAASESINGRIGYQRFLLQYPGITIKRIKVNYEKYFEECWQKSFGVKPDFNVRVVLSRLQSCQKITAVPILDFITYMKLHREDSIIPGIKEINTFFSVEGNADWRDKLKNLVAMEQEKKRICEIIQQQIYLKKLEEEGLCDNYVGVRAVISGNPGVGKSTLLEIVENAFREEGLVKKGSTYVSCRSLISDHVGGTEKNFRELAKECDLIIFDELGGLTVKDQFNAGLVQEIVYLTENRKDIHIFFIGYESDVNAFLKLNEGIRSRIQSFISIADYTKEELSQIGMFMLKSYHYNFDSEKIQKVLDDFVEKLVKIPDFGNARAMRVLMNHLNIIKSAEFDKERTLNMCITVEEMEQAVERYFENQPKEKEKTVIGFA